LKIVARETKLHSSLVKNNRRKQRTRTLVRKLKYVKIRSVAGLGIYGKDDAQEVVGKNEAVGPDPRA
jgi:hypothetical protein